MRKLLLAIILSMLSAEAIAGTVHLGAEFGAPNGYSQQLAMPDCSGSNPASVQCMPVPGRIIGWSGTLTVKRPMIEMVAVVICNGEVVSQTQQFQGTLVIVSPAVLPTELTGPCWVIYELANNGPPTPPGGAWEIQLVIFYQ